MELSDPALVVALFFAAGDVGVGRLWQAVMTDPPKGAGTVRRRQVSLDGATVVQVSLERSGEWPATVWQEMAQAMTRWLGPFWESPPGRAWGGSRIYLGAVVAGPHEERALIGAGLAVPAETVRRVVPTPFGRIWLVSPAAVAERSPLVATYAWFHAPVKEVRAEVERWLWNDAPPLLRAELYLHRALAQLRQYRREERATFWAALERLEEVTATSLSAGAGHLGSLQAACQVVLQNTARLGRLHTLLSSSAHLYRQIGSELRQEKGGLFSWYEERQREAIVQWGYDLERADRALALARTALAVLSLNRSSAPAGAPSRASPLPPERASSGRPFPQWLLSLIAAAVLALCLVEDNWTVVLIRLGVVLAFLLLAWWVFRWQRRSGGPQSLS